MRQLSIYTHMNSLWWTIWPEALVYIHSTLLAYRPEQVCLPYCTCMSHTLLLYSTNRPHITPQIHHKLINFKMYFPNYFKVCANNKYAPQIPNMCYMPNLLNMHLWKEHASIYSTYEVAPINDVARIAVRGDYDNDNADANNDDDITTMTMTPQPNYICWICH